MNIEHIVVCILREAAFRAFLDNPRPGTPTLRFLLASQRYI